MVFIGRFVLTVLIFVVHVEKSNGQKKYKDPSAYFSTPGGYSAHFTTKAPVIDGEINDDAWKKASWSGEFVDIEGAKKPLPPFKTRMKMLWNDSCLFVAAALEEPHVWASLKQHDAIVYHDNDFEVFIDPDNDAHEYFEIEVNAFNTIFDLFMSKPYRNGGKAFIPF